MNQTFSFTRFTRILRKYFTDNRGQLLANLGLLIGVLVAVTIFLYRSYPREIDDMRYKIMLVVGWGGWYIFIMQQITALNEKQRAINYLMQPASALEKITLLWLISGVGFLVVFFAVYTLIDAIGIGFVNNRNWTPEQLNQIRRIGGLLELKPWYASKALVNIPVTIWVFTAIFHAVYMMLSFMLRRYTIALGVVLTLAIAIFTTLLNTSLIEFFTGNSTIRTAGLFSPVLLESPDQTSWRLLDLPQPIGNQIRYLVAGLVAVLSYITAYVGLKEREV
ncbi:hypothetical protein IC229_11575 [Spirosoma sp. BT702]|uniref:Uncharacterized protein n=1 Tax=Spirosoma profusum TaxID=2771354 RepID=A0A927ASH4_9BACT|nr:hypothetical protein [Spirosoma profusum]MBD2701280.1 hypothetical protein [Spirosoma profusum]